MTSFEFISSSAPKYLYLAKEEWRAAWIGGGEIPIFPTAKYLSEIRGGTNTPDEVTLSNKGEASMAEVSKIFRVHPGINLTIKDVGINFSDGRGDLAVELERNVIKGYVLSLANGYSLSIQERLGKVCCVKIANVDELCRVAGKRLGCKGQHGLVAYTPTDERNVFLKGDADAWQDEYRLFFPAPALSSLKAKPVRIPAVAVAYP